MWNELPVRLDKRKHICFHDIISIIHYETTPKFMKIMLSACLVMLQFSSFSQVKLRKKTLNNNHLYTEKFYVLDTNKNVRHGEYFKLTNDKAIVENGNYEYGKKIGNWRYFGGETLFLTYNFDTQKVINFKKIEDSTIIRIGEKYLKVIPDNPLMPIASYLELYSLAYQHPTLTANYQYQQNLLLFIDNEGHFIEAKINFPEKNETIPIKINGIEKIQWIPPMIGNTSYESVYVLRYR